MKRILVYLAVFLAAVVLAAAASAQTLTWHSDQLIRYTTYDAGYPSVAISGNNAVAVWTHRTSGSFDQIFASYSTDKGKTWSSPVDVDYSTLQAQNPKVAISGNNVVVVFSQYDGDESRIYANYSTNGGQTWGGAQLIEDNGATTAGARLTKDLPADIGARSGYDPQVAMSGGNVVVIWRQYDGSNHRIYANRSTNGGQTWGTDVMLDQRSYNAQEPRLAMSGNNVVAVWAQNDGITTRIYSAYSANAGGTWAPDQLIESGDNEAFYPSVAISGNNVVVVWLVWFGNPINLSRLFSNRASFSGGTLTWAMANTQRIDTNDAMEAQESQVAISGEKVVVVWQQEESGTYHLYTSHSSDAGASWSANQLLVADDTVNGYSPQIAISGSNAMAVWTQEIGVSGNHVYARHSFDGGSTWEDPELIEDNAGKNAQTPMLAISGNDVVSVWIQISDGTSGTGILTDDPNHAAVYSNYATFSGSTIIVALDGSGGGCFIATAAFGSPLAGQVEVLRQFRDKYLLTNALGKKFVSWYYRNGPVAAAFIADKPLAKLAVQAALYPLIGFSFVLVNGFMPFVLMGLLLAGVVFFRFRFKKLGVE